MKKVLSVLLVIIMLFLNCGIAASALGNFAGKDMLKKQFISGDKVGGYTFDYYYYSPVEGASDKTKYPIILWLHGQLSGEFKGDQIRESDIVYLASDENQAKIKGAGGAYILVPRFPAINSDVALSWVGASSDIKKFVDKFISDNKANVDTNRIYVGGYSMGGRAAMKFAAAYPNYVAAIFPAASIYLGADCRSDLRALINTPAWFFTNKEDNFWGKPTPQSSDWNYFCSIANDKADIRWTQFTMNYGNDTGLLNYDGTRIKMIGYTEHNAWDPPLHDLIMKDGKLYPNILSTVNGYNTKVNLTVEKSFLYWLSSYSLNGIVGEEGGDVTPPDDDQGGSGSGNQGSSGIRFYHVREVLEFIATLFDRVYKALFTVR